MKTFLLLTTLISTQIFAQEVKLRFPLTLGGDFVGKAKIHNGKVAMKGGKYMAKNLVVKVKEISTGVGLRDDHVHKKLKGKKFPKIEIIKAFGKKGSGTALVKIRGVKKKVPFTFDDKGKKVEFKLDIKLSDFNIDRKKEGFVYLGVGIKEKVEVTGYLKKSGRSLASK